MSKTKVGKLVHSIQADTQQLLAGQVGATKAIQEITAAQQGRPKGARNRKVDQTDGELTRCKCGSTDREPYFNKRELNISGDHAITGKPYTLIIIRRTRCRGCGQARDDRHFVNAPRKRR